MRRVLIAGWLSVAIAAPASALAANKTWNFTAARVTPCEGIGVAGSYSIRSVAVYTKTDGAVLITELSVTVDSAAFGAGDHPGFSSALVEKDRQGKVVKKTLLASAWFDVLTAGGTAITRYLPPAKAPATPQTPQLAVKAAAGNTLHLSVSPVVSIDNQSCPLGASENLLDF